MDLRESIRSHSDFSLSLATHVSKIRVESDPTKNVVLSPLSVHIAVGMVAAGAAGETAKQTVEFLRHKSGEELASVSSQIVSLILADGSAAGGPKVAFAGGVWVEATMPLKSSFSNAVLKTYGSEAKNADFKNKHEEVRNEVNTWVDGKSNGLIKDLLPSGSVDNLTRLILANALYFKGAWDKKFDSSKTVEGEFHLLNGEKVQVPYMTSGEKQFVGDYAGFKVLKLPYAHGEDKRQFSMYIYLPEERNGLLGLMEKIGGDSEFIDRHSPSSRVSATEFKLPKFKISSGIEASSTLKELGLVLPFSKDSDLSEMVDSPDGKGLFVSNIFHKSFIEVNEEGTEAAAAAAATIQLRSFARPTEFVADHPFMFLIREDATGLLLFVGHVINPLVNE